MNKERREILAGIAEKFRGAIDELEGVIQAESEARDNLPESFTNKLSEADELIATLESAKESIETEIEMIESVAGADADSSEREAPGPGL